jgi:hypothetical protein
MIRKVFVALVAAFAFGVGGMAHATPVLQMGSFISSPNYSNGFEGFGTTGVGSRVDYAEGGIRLQSGNSPYGVISRTNFGTSVWPGPGNFVAYQQQNYATITLTSGEDFQSFQFAASTGFGSPSVLAYQLLNNGAVVLTGTVANPAFCCNSSGGTFMTLGFTGGGFDEVRLQDYVNISAFNPSLNESYLTLDNMLATVSTVPEPATLALLGFGLLGFGRRRRKAKAA